MQCNINPFALFLLLIATAVGLKMDSWNYMSEGRGVYLSEDFDLQYDTHGYNKSQLIGHEFKPLLNVENYPLLSNTQALERLNFMEMGFSDEIRKSYSISSDPSGEVFSDEIGSDYNNVASPFDKEKYYGSRIASSVFMQSENKDFSLVDLKLGRLANGKVRKDGELSVANVPGSCIGSSPRVKRSRSTSSYIKSLRCQVLGCNKDLSSYKDYYKRNKVCDEHTRAARVTVNGMEQRFCQQCSRFHQLAEFDDDKRSCRKRLAAHNKRRRKPRFPSKPASTSQRTTPALSLLSSHSRNGASSQLLGTVTTSPMLNDSPDILDDMGQKGFLETGMYSMEADNMDPTMISNTVDLHLPSDGILREADLRDTHLGHGIILDLFELSSCLQRIQQQRHSTGSETE